MTRLPETPLVRTVALLTDFCNLDAEHFSADMTRLGEMSPSSHLPVIAGI